MPRKWEEDDKYQITTSSILQTSSKVTTMKQMSYRKTKAIKISLLKSEVLMEVPCHRDCNSPDNFVELYKRSLNQLMDKFTPLKTMKVSDRLKLPGINDTVTAEVRKKEDLRRPGKKTSTTMINTKSSKNNIKQCTTSSTKLRRISNIITTSQQEWLQGNLQHL